MSQTKYSPNLHRKVRRPDPITLPAPVEQQRTSGLLDHWIISPYIYRCVHLERKTKVLQIGGKEYSTHIEVHVGTGQMVVLDHRAPDMRYSTYDAQELHEILTALTMVHKYTGDHLLVLNWVRWCAKYGPMTAEAHYDRQVAWWCIEEQL